MSHDLADAFKRRRARRFLLKFFVATSLLALLPFGVVRWRRSRPKTPYTFPFAELGALDKVVQARFAVVPDKDFGADRIGKRHEYFNPATPQEQNAVSSLPRGIFFYVVGSNALLERHPASYPRIVQGPILMSPRVPLKTQHTVVEPRISSSSSVNFHTPGLLPRDLPSQAVLKRLGKEALTVFETREGFTQQSSAWEIALRPVRASDQACINCHWYIGKAWYGAARMRPALGDTLGVAMYAYRTKKEKK